MPTFAPTPRPGIADLNTSSYRYQCSVGQPRYSAKARRHLSAAQIRAEEVQGECVEKEQQWFFCNHVCQCPRPKKYFSKSQLSKPATLRACYFCIDKAILPEHRDGLLCVECGWRRGHNLFLADALFASSHENGVQQDVESQATTEYHCCFCIANDAGLYKRDKRVVTALTVHWDFFRQLQRWFWDVIWQYGVCQPQEETIPNRALEEFNNEMPKQLRRLFVEYCTRDVKTMQTPAQSRVDDSEVAYRCVECERDWPRSFYTKTQLKKSKASLRCKHCTHGPDVEDFDMLDNASDPPGWHSETDYYKQRYYDEHGRVLEKWRRQGILRLMKLSHIRFTQESCSDRFRHGRVAIQALVGDLRKAGCTDEPLRVVGAQIKVCLYKGRYWSVDNRRLWALKQALSPNQLIEVRYFHEPGFLQETEPHEYHEFIRKFTTTFDGLEIEVRRGGHRSCNARS